MNEIKVKELLNLLSRDDPFYGIYMVYDMYGPLWDSENSYDQEGAENGRKN